MSNSSDIKPEILENEELPTKVHDLICFALYSANNAMNRSYKPHLKALGLTYPQYIALVALWESDGVSVGQLCGKLMLETSTLTPVLQRLEKLGHIVRKRSEVDERKVFLQLTKSGKALQEKSAAITGCIIDSTSLPLLVLDELVATLATLRDSMTKELQAERGVKASDLVKPQ